MAGLGAFSTLAVQGHKVAVHEFPSSPTKAFELQQPGCHKYNQLHCAGEICPFLCFRATYDRKFVLQMFRVVRVPGGGGGRESALPPIGSCPKCYKTMLLCGEGWM